jgi:MFS family permease
LSAFSGDTPRNAPGERGAAEGECGADETPIRGKPCDAGASHGATGVATPSDAGGETLSTLALENADVALPRVGIDSEAPPASHVAPDAAARASASRRGLDWFVFFVADVQTGFGPFVAVYLTTHAWSQGDIGLILTIGGLVALAGQMPGGALVDAVRSQRWAAALAVIAIGISALVLALWPIFLVVIASRVLHALASCVLGPAIAAISLRLVGHASLGERIGRNARFASIGCILAAAGMGLTGHLLSNQAVFLVTAALIVPTLFALARVRTDGPAVPKTMVEHGPAASLASLRRLLCNGPLMIFAGCVLLFHLANAALLPVVGGVMATRSSEWAIISIAACMIVPQLIVAACAPWVGRQAVEWGRRPLLVAAFAALGVRCALFAFVADPHLVIAVQALDGISAAVLGVMFPLVVADITRGTGGFSLGLGIVGSAVGIGASLSTVLAGYLVDHIGHAATFAALTGVATAGLVVVAFLMPETRPDAHDPMSDAMAEPVAA